RVEIDPLFAYLREKRTKVFRDVIRNLADDKYKYILDGWNAFLNSSLQVSSDASKAGVPIRDLARKKIDRKYRRIVKDGSLILKDSNDEMLHALRIHCKELRYLLEFFSSLFPREKVDACTRQLKKLQDMLGAFNDFGVQEQYLAEVSRELRATGRQAEKNLAAIGVLIDALAGKKQKVKDAFSETFMEFASLGNQKAFREIFASKAGSSVDNKEGETS
ncbi:MAG TPA: CHAD domain-containing protein, partial [Nitrospiria bacterium]|nr:CHAD domain-containing protein [Nitrospiria bacterium]